jgi:hypothetical protein
VRASGKGREPRGGVAARGVPRHPRGRRAPRQAHPSGAWKMTLAPAGWPAGFLAWQGTSETLGIPRSRVQAESLPNRTITHQSRSSCLQN